MKVYVIDIPEVSNGLRRTFNKNLEVFECEAVFNEHRSQYELKEIFYIHTYNSKKGWVKKETKKSPKVNSFSFVYSEIASKNNHFRVGCTFSTFELAAISKLFLIKEMGETYKKELEELQKLFDRNVPNIDKPLRELSEEFPEFFL